MKPKFNQPVIRRNCIDFAEWILKEGFEKYDGSYSNKDMLFYLTKYIKDNINRNIQDSTGQSLNVDDYLGHINSKEREKRRVAISQIYRRMEDSERDNSATKWKNIMGDKNE